MNLLVKPINVPKPLSKKRDQAIIDVIEWARKNILA